MANDVITNFEVGERLDKTLAQMYPEYSRSAIEKLIQNGQITVNDKQVKTKYTLKSDDVIEASFSELTKEVESIVLPIVYQDADVVVVDKPVGILAHSKGAFNKEGTVASFIQPMLNGSEEWKNTNRAGIVHRLDRGTSGIMITAKTEAAQSFLGKQFSTRNVKKTYTAVIKGQLGETEATIDVPIERNPKKPATFRPGANGKPAQTDYKVITTNGEYSLVELKPLTGRTHQLRVHLNYLKHPIVGDEFYGGEPAPRLMLHAYKLEITLPNKERKTFTAAVPKEFTELVQ